LWRRSGDLSALEARLSVLRSVPELGDCSDSQLRTLLQHVDEVTVQRGCQIAGEGKPCSQLVIVAAGRLRTVSNDGRRQALQAGDPFGWTAMWERGLNDATVVAETDARLLVVSHGQFRAFQAVTNPPAADADAQAQAAGLRRQAS
jgi:CRP-like cAMP-binding protein